MRLVNPICKLSPSPSGYFRRWLPGGLMALLVLSTTTMANVQIAQAGNKPATKPISPSTTQPISVVFVPRKGNSGAPRTTAAGGSRDLGQCSKLTATTDTQTLIALLPPLPTGENRAREGLTLQAHPTILVYVPATSARSGEFTLWTDKKEEVFQTMVVLPPTPAVVRVPLPPTTPGLAVGKRYQWLFVLACKPSGVDPSDPKVGGVISRIEPDTAFAQQITQAKGLEQVRLYANAGIWHEAATELASLRLANPSDRNLLAAWQSLLQSVNLGSVALTPIR